MNFDSPDALETYADRLAANGGDLEAGVLRAFARAWQADRRSIDSLQDENTGLQAELTGTRERYRALSARSQAAARAILEQAA